MPDEAAALIASLLFLCTLVGFALVYVNHAPQRTSFQIKIVGLSLFTVLAVLTIASTTLSQGAVPVTLPAGQALRLMPTDSNRYVAKPIPTHFDSVLGNPLLMPDRTEAPVDLGWPVRFFGREWRQMRVRQRGSVRFGTKPMVAAPNHFPFVDPFIALIGGTVQLNRARVFLKQTRQGITVTWESAEIASQLVLYREGAMDFG